MPLTSMRHAIRKNKADFIDDFYPEVLCVQGCICSPRVASYHQVVVVAITVTMFSDLI